MIRLIFPRRPAEDEPMEDLLRRAAEFHPETGPPDGLEWKALSGVHARRSAGLRLQRAVLVTACVAGALAVVFILPRGRPGQETANIDGRILPPEPIGSLREIMPEPPQAMLVSHTPAVSPPALAGFRPEPREEPARRTATTGKCRNPRKPRLAPRRLRPEIRETMPTVRWEVETVRYEVSRVMTPGFIVEGQDENGEWKLTPGVVELVTRTEPEVVACGVPDGIAEPASDGSGTSSTPGGAPVEETENE